MPGLDPGIHQENLSFRDAPLGAGPESIVTMVVMDSGLATASRPGMTSIQEDGSSPAMTSDVTTRRLDLDPRLPLSPCGRECIGSLLPPFFLIGAVDAFPPLDRNERGG